MRSAPCIFVLYHTTMILLAVTFEQILFAAVFMMMIALAWLLAEFKGLKDEIRERTDINNETLKLRLQAHERLTLYAERASLKNLVARTPYFDRTVVDYQLALLDALKTEYEYNVTQQIYVSVDLWKAVTNLRDQNSYIINQIAAMLPQQANAVELSKRLLEYASNEKAELSPIVLDAIQFEAKKFL